MNKCCYNCKNYKDAKCDILRNGLLSLVVINNLEPDDKQYNYEIDQKIMITTEFAKKLRCDNFEERKTNENL